VHHIHTTDGFVIGSKPHGEAGKIIFIYTRDLGFLTAIAQGIRLEKSKLRYSICDYNFASFSLVHGKEFWRIVGASEMGNRYSKEKEKQRLAIFGPISLILRRLLHGQESCVEIFDCLINCTSFIESEPMLNSEWLKTVESLTVARILYRLGYVGSNNTKELGLESLNYTGDLIGDLISKRTIINQKINLALKESHL
jgi:recombinational DNA repair protein (RecF pathway)